MTLNSTLGGLGGVALLVLRPLAATAQPIPIPLPLERTADGVTLSIAQAGFYHEHEFPLRTFGGGQADRKGFMMGYSLRPVGAAPPTPGKGTVASPLGNSVTAVHLFAPDGELLYPSLIASSTDGGFEKWDGVAPYWKAVKADLEWRLPGAPVGADGKFQEVLNFENVPLPAKFDEPREVDQLLTTAHGTEVMLESVVAHAVKDAQGGIAGKLDVKVSWEYAAEVPDANVELSLDSVKDGAGHVLQGSGSSSRQKNVYTFPGIELPGKAAKTVNVAIQVAEDAPSLKQPQWFKHIVVDLPLPAPRPASPPAASKVAVIATAAEVTGELESGSATDYELQGRLWLRGATVLPGQEWFVKQITGHDEAGNELKSGFEPMAGSHIFWKADDRPAVLGERDQSFLLYFKNNVKPKQLSVEATVEPVHHVRHVFHIAALPLPRPGKALQLNQAVRNDAGAQLTVRQVAYFTNPGTLVGLDAAQRQSLQPQRGVAVVVEAPAALGADAKQYLNFSHAHDNQGRTLASHHAREMSDGNVLEPGAPKPHVWTVYLAPPANDATTADVYLVSDEVLVTGAPQTLTFHDVPLPAPVPTYF